MRNKHHPRGQPLLKFVCNCGAHRLISSCHPIFELFELLLDESLDHGEIQVKRVERALEVHEEDQTEDLEDAGEEYPPLRSVSRFAYPFVDRDISVADCGRGCHQEIEGCQGGLRMRLGRIFRPAVDLDPETHHYVSQQVGGF